MALRLLDVHHAYGGRPALRGISLHLAPGDCYGFIGHNGAGKTTAMRIALGLVRPDRGRVLVEGFDARLYPREARARLGGLIETPGFHAALSGRTNLELLAGAAGLGRAAARRAAEEALERVGLAADGLRAAGGYSQGMRQRLGIAQALLGRPRVVLLDEPTNGLDPEGIRDARLLFASLVRDEGVALLISSHQLHELQGLCNKIGVLRAGELVVEAETEALLAAADRPYRLRAGDERAAQQVLSALGLVPVQRGGDLMFALGGRRPGEVGRALVQAGVELLSFAPETPALEEIVLAARQAPARPAAAPAAAPPRERIAPARPTLLAAAYEARRLSAGAAAPVVLLLPAAAGLLALVQRWREVAREEELVRAGELFGTTSVTAFEGVGVALRAGLPLLALVAAGLASQALAGELARGTLRNLLLRPVGRARAALGKALTLLSAAALGYVALLATALGGAALLFDFGDVQEVLPNGLVYTHLSAAALWPELLSVSPACLPAVLAAAAVGLCAGAFTRSPAGALALALGSLVGLDLARGFARPFGLEGWSLTAELPSPLGDRSAVATYLDICRGVSNALEPIALRPVPASAAWLLLGLSLAAWRLSRRPIP